MIAIAALGAGGAVAQDAPKVPLFDGNKRTGVADCTSAGCHGDQVSGAGVGTVVGQNEYYRWRSAGQRGAHSRAYAVLMNDQSRRIAENLGIGPAHQARECLSCHADNVAPALRGERFQLADGVSCEACHGGSENWLASHRSAPGHEYNVANGLYPLEMPVARGELCLGCHLGSTTDGQFVTHRIMGAGHPRLKFELDLYTAMQSHHTIDDDYRARKMVASGAKVWAIGQAVALQRMLALVSDRSVSMDGAFPEFVFFDCHACHQPISDESFDLSWRRNPSRGLDPGALAFNDANLIMLIAAARVVEPSLADRLDEQGRALQMASQRSHSAFLAAARDLRDTADALITRFEGRDFADGLAGKAILDEIVAGEFSERYTNYAAAEQALFAVQRLIADIAASGDLAPARSRRIANAITEAGRAVESPYTYNQIEFQQALARIKATLNEG
jgi:hypothetical protein